MCIRGTDSPWAAWPQRDLPDGVISPGSIGYDINCGVRLLASDLFAEEVEPFLGDLATALYANCPSGLGKGGRYRLTEAELEAVLRTGARWCVGRGLATEEDVRHTEESGCLQGAAPARVSQRARDRGRDQLGTLGSGNHFLEVDEVVAVYDEDAAAAFGLRPGQVVVQIHCGSRGLGHQVCTEYVRSFQDALQRYGIRVAGPRTGVCAVEHAGG